MSDGSAAPFAYGGDEYVVLGHFAMASRAPQGALTHAERDIVALLLAGLSDRAIAKARGVSPRTVAKQLSSIYRKTGAGGRVAICGMFGRVSP